MPKQSKLKTVINSLMGDAQSYSFFNNRSSFQTFYSRIGKISNEDLSFLYLHDSIVMKIVDDIANESTKYWRKWRVIEGDVSGDSSISEILKLEDRLNVKHVWNKAIKKARLFGGAVIVMNVLDGRNMNESIDFEHPLLDIEAMSTYTQNELSDKNNFKNGVPEVIVFKNGEKIHRDRVCILCGTDISIALNINDKNNSIKKENSIIGQSSVLSVLKTLYDYNLTELAISKMVNQPFIDIYKLNFDKYAKKGITPSEIRQAMTRLNEMKGGDNGVTIDVGDSYNVEYRRFDTIVTLQHAQMKKISGDVGIPMTRLFGESINGLSSSGVDETRKYYDKITDYQKNEIEKSLKPLDNLMKKIVCSEKSSIDFEWISLWEMNEKDKIEVEQSRANLLKIYIESNIITKEEAREYLKQDKYLKKLI